jgi:hypothetical protein
MPTPSPESLVRLLVYVGGVASTMVGSLVSSKIRVYHDNRKSHLDDIKQKVLLPLNEGLSEKHASLVTHRSPVVVEHWGLQRRKENVSVTEQPDEHGPLLTQVVPDVRTATDPTLYADAKKKHFSKLIVHADEFLAAWQAHAVECRTWVSSLADEILANSELPPHPALLGSRYIMQYRLAVFVYMRLFNSSGAAVSKRNQNFGSQTPSWVLESGVGAAAGGTEEDMDRIMSQLDRLVEREKGTAKRLHKDARALEQKLESLRGELNYAIASRRLRRKCDLVPFF